MSEPLSTNPLLQTELSAVDNVAWTLRRATSPYDLDQCVLECLVLLCSRELPHHQCEEKACDGLTPIPPKRFLVADAVLNQLNTKVSRFITGNCAGICVQPSSCGRSRVVICIKAETPPLQASDSEDVYCLGLQKYILSQMVARDS
ncbi:hypothetical protein IF1G_10206 [Cordyceps javanica]|uniref:Uncharacterized protein n=1 Tax=Cordyceps javanica TaxID=43265 RepID=A0A545UNE9_9HYPO|nr:hypothetical protein IF1G_10206 [Cordyceps javanica]